MTLDGEGSAVISANTPPATTATTSSPTSTYPWLRHLHLFHRASGHAHVSKCFLPGADQVLDASSLLAMVSSMAAYAQSVLGDELRELVVGTSRVVVRDIGKGKYLLVAHVDQSVGGPIVAALFRDIIAICEYHFGGAEWWDDEEGLDVQGAADLIVGHVQRTAQDPSLLAGGLKQTFLEPDASEKLSSLLAFVESADGVYANSSSLIVGEDTVVCTRMETHHARMAVMTHRLRPLTTMNNGPVALTLRMTPVHVNGNWRAMWMVRVEQYVLIFHAYLDRAFAGVLQQRVDDFKLALANARLELPVEPPAITLRLFSKRETFSMLYQNTRTGLTVHPELRASPEAQQRENASTFWSGWAQAVASMSVPGVREFSVVKDGYRFYGRHEGVHRLYLLLDTASTSDVSSASSVWSSVLKSVIARSTTTLM